MHTLTCHPPSGTRAVTLSGHQLDNVEVTPLTVSELLRLFLSHQSNLGPVSTFSLLESLYIDALPFQEMGC